jgi:UDP-N-acetylglucosamine 2-epimerase (non-hydrolysing)
MLWPVLKAFGIHSDVTLEPPNPGLSITELSTHIMSTVARHYAKERPQLVMVQGDTTTAFAAAMAAFWARIPLAHVEAGLRTGDLTNPFPEESNRVLIDRIATICFAPTERNRASLLKEGIESTRIVVTGNTGIDALLSMQRRVSRSKPPLVKGIDGKRHRALRTSGTTILVTLHRRETFGPRMAAVLLGIAALAREQRDWRFLFPVHFNPGVRKPALRILSRLTNVTLLEPVPYPDFVRLMALSSAIVTDSGGIQEEAPSLGKPVLVVRDKTERQEAVRAKLIEVVGVHPGDLRRALRETIEREHHVNSRTLAGRTNPFGDGRAANRIAMHLSRLLKTGQSKAQPSDVHWRT